MMAADVLSPVELRVFDVERFKLQRRRTSGCDGDAEALVIGRVSQKGAFLGGRKRACVALSYGGNVTVETLNERLFLRRLLSCV